MSQHTAPLSVLVLTPMDQCYPYVATSDLKLTAVLCFSCSIRFGAIRSSHLLLWFDMYSGFGHTVEWFACYDHVMFASQQLSDCYLLRGVSLHCREMGMIYVCCWKQKAWVWISAMWLQVMMSVSKCMLLHNVWPLVVWYNILVPSMFPNSNIGWPTKS